MGSHPKRSDHKIMLNILRNISKDVEATPEELSVVSRVFVRAGGSWRGVFKGSTEDMTLLKKVLKVAVDSKNLSCRPKWV